MYFPTPPITVPHTLASTQPSNPPAKDPSGGLLYRQTGSKWAALREGR